MRKKIIGLALCGLLLTAVPQKTHTGFLDNKDAGRQIALIIASLMVTCGGTYLVSKKSHGILNKFLSIIGGFGMIGAGFAGIVLSESILATVDHLIEQANKGKLN